MTLSKKAIQDTALQPSFETCLSELEEAVGKLEAGALPLEESLQLFEKGVASLKQCHAILDKAEQRIRILVKGASGEPALEDADISVSIDDVKLGAGASDNFPVAKKSGKQSLDSEGKKGQNDASNVSKPKDPSESDLW